jgi:hypothetical protein
MKLHLRLLTGALTTVFALVLSAASATSNRSIQVTPGGSATASGRLTIIGTSLDTNSSIKCDITLLRTVPTKIPKVAGTQWGRVTGFVIDRGETTSSPHCQIGAFRNLSDLVPLAGPESPGRRIELGGGVLRYDLTASRPELWSVIYDSFQGTLPDLTGLNYHIRGAALQIAARGPFYEQVTCLYSGEIYGLLRVVSRRLVGSEIVLSRTRMTLGPGGLGCSIGATATLSGSLGFGPGQDVLLVEPGPLPIIVSVGDSYIGGEGGRWAGNTAELPSSAIDALGPTAYFDAGIAESIPFCHRSQSAEIHIGAGVISKNFACTGARTYTHFEEGQFKPGLDFWVREGRKSQSVMLREYAEEHREIKLVAVSIGGNDFSFASMIEYCVRAFLVYRYCREEDFALRQMSEPTIRIATDGIRQAIVNVRQAMREAGYADNSYTIMVQNYPSPIPTAANRYDETYRERVLTGGCPLYDADIAWATTGVLPTINTAVANAVAQTGLTNIKRLKLESAFASRGLCQFFVGLLEEKRLRSWREPGAVDETEWITQIRMRDSPPFMKQEGFHPNYWAQKALRRCLRIAFNYFYGEPLEGSCLLNTTGLNERGEPNMILRLS